MNVIVYQSTFQKHFQSRTHYDEMKILLINPPVRDFFNTRSRRQPLGLLYLAAALLKNGHDVHLLDSGAVRKSKRAAPPADLERLTWPCDADDTSPYKLFGRYYHFGPSFSEIEDETRRTDPDVVGISSLFAAYASEAMACAAAARKAAPSVTIVLGGGHPTFMPYRALESNTVDYVIAGEGEEAFAELIDAIQKGVDPARIHGVAGRTREGTFFFNQPRFQTDIDSFDLPARELLDPGAYLRRGRRMAMILSSRGCPNRCAFCCSHLTSGRVFRPRRPADVVREMIQCRDLFGITAFDFEDDNLTCETRRAKELMKLIVKSFGERSLWLEAMNGIAMQGLTPDLLDLMFKAGFRNINLAPLSADPKERSRMDRPDALNQSMAIPRLASRIGFHVTAYMMIGYPGQAMPELMANIGEWSKEPVLLAPSVFYPAPGSGIQAQAYPYLNNAGHDRWALTRSSLFPEVPGGLKQHELRTAFWMIRLANFARSVLNNPDPRELGCLMNAFINRPDLELARKGDRIQLAAKRRLNGHERGLAALIPYIREASPHGIRLARRSKGKESTQYELFPLDGMIKNKKFYLETGIPGFGPGVFNPHISSSSAAAP